DLDGRACLELLRMLIDLLHELREEDVRLGGALAVQKLPDHHEREDQSDPEQNGFVTLTHAGFLSMERSSGLKSIAAKPGSVKHSFPSKSDGVRHVFGHEIDAHDA